MHVKKIIQPTKETKQTSQLDYWYLSLVLTLMLYMSIVFHDNHFIWQNHELADTSCFVLFSHFRLCFRISPLQSRQNNTMFMIAIATDKHTNTIRKGGVKAGDSYEYA